MAFPTCLKSGTWKWPERLSAMWPEPGPTPWSPRPEAVLGRGSGLPERLLQLCKHQISEGGTWVPSFGLDFSLPAHITKPDPRLLTLVLMTVGMSFISWQLSGQLRFFLQAQWGLVSWAAGGEGCCVSILSSQPWREGLPIPPSAKHPGTGLGIIELYTWLWEGQESH